MDNDPINIGTKTRILLYNTCADGMTVLLVSELLFNYPQPS